MLTTEAQDSKLMRKTVSLETSGPGSDLIHVHASHAMQGGLCVRCGSNNPSKLLRVCAERWTGQYD
jgi:hypothetical protein